MSWATLFTWNGNTPPGLAPHVAAFAVQSPGASNDLGVHVNRSQDNFDTATPPCFYFVPGLYFIHATWRYDWANRQNINRLKLYTLPHTAGSAPVHDSGDQIYTYITGEDLSYPLEHVLNSYTYGKSTYLRLGAYNNSTQFGSHGSMSELHFYNAKLTAAQETYLLQQMSTKWSAIA